MDQSLAFANGINKDGGLDPKFFQRIEDDLLAVTEMYKLSALDRQETQRAFGSSRDKAQEELRGVHVRPFEVAETVKVSVDSNTGVRSAQITPERMIAVENNLKIVEHLMQQILIHGSTGDTKLDDTVRYMYGKLKELIKVREEENHLQKDPLKDNADESSLL